MSSFLLERRRAGILMPLFSLPGKYGIGSFSKEAREFVRFLKEAGQSYWQILPMGPTGYGDSPYQSFSTFAGNPYFIDLDTLAEEGLLLERERGISTFPGRKCALASALCRFYGEEAAVFRRFS